MLNNNSITGSTTLNLKKIKLNEIILNKNNDDKNPENGEIIYEENNLKFFDGIEYKNFFSQNPQDTGRIQSFGNGFHGNVTLSGFNILSEDKYYNNLTLNQNAELKTNGWKIYVKNTLTMNNNSKIHNSTSLASTSPNGSMGGGGQGLRVGFHNESTGLSPINQINRISHSSSSGSIGVLSLSSPKGRSLGSLESGYILFPNLNEPNVIADAMELSSPNNIAIFGGFEGASAPNNNINNNNLNIYSGSGGGLVFIAARYINISGVAGIEAKGGDAITLTQTVQPDIASSSGGGGGGIIICTTTPQYDLNNKLLLNVSSGNNSNIVGDAGITTKSQDGIAYIIKCRDINILESDSFLTSGVLSLDVSNNIFNSSNTLNGVVLENSSISGFLIGDLSGNVSGNAISSTLSNTSTNLSGGNIINANSATISGVSISGNQVQANNFIGDISSNNLKVVNIDNSGSNLYIGENASNIYIGANNKANIINIGDYNIDTINISASGINLIGNTSFIDVSNSQISDKAIILNKNGPLGSGGGSGIEIEENNNITAFFRQKTNRNGWELKSSDMNNIIEFNNNNQNNIIIDQSSHNPVSISGNNLTISGQVIELSQTPSFTTLTVSGVSISGTHIQATTLIGTVSGTVSGQWSLSGTTLNYTAGNVGIANTNPLGKLHITQNNSPSNNIVDSNEYLLLKDISGNANSGGVIVFGAEQANYFAGIRGCLTGGGNNSKGNLSLCTRTNETDTSLTSKILITSDGNVGIGTSSPSYKLDISSNINSDSVRIQNTNNAGYSTILYQNDNRSVFAGLGGSNEASTLYRNKFYYTSNANTDLIFNTGGNLGIGTTNPSEKLDLNGSIKINSGNNVKLYGPDVNHSIFMQIGKDSANNVFDICEFGDIRFFTGGLLASQTEKMRITSGGNVGIGTNNPLGKLHISQSNSPSNDINDNTSNYLLLKDISGNAGSGGVITFGAAQGNCFGGIRGSLIDGANNTLGNINICLRTNNNDNSLSSKMIIQNNGYVGIGTTSPGYTLDVSGSINCKQMRNNGYTQVFGRVDTNGTMVQNSENLTDFTCSKTSTGTYVFKYNNSWDIDNVINISINNDTNYSPFVVNYLSNGSNLIAYTYDQFNALRDIGFSFSGWITL